LTFLLQIFKGTLVIHEVTDWTRII